MASDYDENPAGNGFLRQIREAYVEMRAVRQLYYEEKPQGVSLRTKRLLASRARSYYDVLEEYKDENRRVKDRWEESKVEQIPKLHNAVVDVQTATAGDSPSSATTQRNALVAQDPEYIIKLTKELDDIRHELQFAAPVADDTPHDEPDITDLRGLVETREQEESAEKIPSGD